MICCSYCPNLGAGIATRYVLNASGFELLEIIDVFLHTSPEQSWDPLKKEFFAEGKTAWAWR